MAPAIPEHRITTCQRSRLASVLADIVAAGNNAERCLAVQALGKLAQPGASEALIGALRDPDPDVRCDAAAALAKLNETAACQALLENLRNDPDAEAKTQYIKALQGLGSTQCDGLLLALATGRGEDDQIAWDDAYSDWDDWLDVQLAAVEALGVLGSGRAPDVIEQALLDPEGQDLWPVACTALARLGQSGLDKLQHLLPRASALNRKRIAAALAMAPPGPIASLMKHLVGDEDAHVRLAVIESAAATGNEDTLLLGLEDVAPEVRAASVAGLGHRHAHVLDKALSDISPLVVTAACKTIEQAGRPIAGLALTSRIERSLRTKSADLVAALLSAAAVAEPHGKAELIQDVCNHGNTDPKVRRACLRAALRLNLPGIIEMLDDAVRAEDQGVRMEAISVLADLARGHDTAADLAAGLLADTIAGMKISAPAVGHEPDTGTVVQFVPKKGKQAAGDDGETTVRLDRDGNLISAASDSNIGETDEVSDAAEAEAAPPPQSTLQAIMAVNPDQMRADRTIELEDADLAFLEMTGSLVRRRKLDPEAKPPAHIDVRRLAASAAGDTGKQVLVTGLSRAATDRDAALSEAALSSLLRLVDHGIDVAQAQHDMIVLAAGRDDGRCRQAVTVLGAIATADAVNAIRHCLGHRSSNVRAAALKALAGAGAMSDEEAMAATDDPDHRVRFAAIAAMGKAGHPDPVALLLDQAQVDAGRHSQEVARLLAGHGREALSALTGWLAGADTRYRYVALGMVPDLLDAIASRGDDHGHAAAS